jgi:hypothetical protein
VAGSDTFGNENIEYNARKIMTKKMKLNKEWHLAHKMPKNPTHEQRLKWHIEHAKNCSCREMPEKLRAEIRKQKLNATKK